MQRTALVWLRRDLRLTDHTPLAYATAEYDQVAVAFVFDSKILNALSNPDDRRLTFIWDSLEELNMNLRKVDSKLVLLFGDPVEKIPELARRLSVAAVVTGKDYEPYAVARDAEVARKLDQIPLIALKDHVVMEEQEVLAQSGGPFRVYTPYRRAWEERFRPSMIAEAEPDLARLMPASNLLASEIASLSELGFKRVDLWTGAGERNAALRLAAFRTQMAQYAADRDFPAIEATSGISVHLRFGTLSIRACFREAMGGDEGSQCWRRELIWREFYQMILANFPNPELEFQEHYRNIHWPGGDELFYKWRDGQTGFPLVDAAMRCLNSTGWMHNRLRMVTASFLTKDLLIDWRRGEAHFARELLDFDLAQNNGGWQWAASTGCDSQPYFRVFNPILQSKKFDPEGTFIRKWCPELSGFSNSDIHDPSAVSDFDQIQAGCILSQDYPRPIVNHHVQRDLAIRLLTR